MKKFLSFVVALCMSATMFAALNPAPAVTDLADYDGTNNVVLVFYFDEQVCNDVYIVGSFEASKWTLTAENIKMEELEGFEGWYVAEVPATDADGKAVQAKPIQAKNDGTLSWDYQGGDPEAWAHIGGAEANISAGYGGESNMEWPAPGFYIYECKYFKTHNSPCSAVDEEYTISAYMPESCSDTIKPYVIGGFNNWTEPGVLMTAGTDGEGETVYRATVKATQGSDFKVYGGNWDAGDMLVPDEEGTMVALQNLQFGDEKTITLDFSNGSYKGCYTAPTHEYVVTVKVPTCGEYTPAIIGDFSNWENVAMTANEDGTFSATVTAGEGTNFKFRDVAFGDWRNEIQVVTVVDEAETYEALPNQKFGKELEINLDFSGEEYTWKACHSTGLVNIDAEKVNAQKVMIDGHVYIIRGEQMFNVVGVEVKK